MIMMGILSRVKTRLRSSLGNVKSKLGSAKVRLASTVWSGTDQPPIVQTLSWPYSFFAEARQGNYIKIYDAMVGIDADLWGYLTRIAHMCKQAFSDVYLVDAGSELDAKETELIEIAQATARKLDFKGEFYDNAFNIMKYGDMVKLMVRDSENGVTELQSLPRRFLTAVETKKQIGDRQATINKANFYVVNEGTDKQVVYEAENCIHIAMNNKSTYIKDLMGRQTFGVWSTSPINTLVWYLEWKINTMINDILWSHRNVPREWHKLDLSQFHPDRFSGTREERETQAIAAAQAAADAYARNLQARQVDVGIVTDKNTEIEYVEPKSTNYQLPNQKIAQINEAISNAIGLPPVAKDTTYASALISGSFAILQAVSIAEIISAKLEEVLKIHITTRYGKKFADKLDKLRIRLRLILEKDRTEIMRQIAVMVESRSFTPTEIRAEWGAPPLTRSQKFEISEMYPPKTQSRPGAIQSLDDVVTDVARKRWTTWPEYPSDRLEPQK